MSALHRFRLSQAATLTAALLLASFAHGQTTPVLVPIPREIRVTAALPLTSGISISVPGSISGADPEDREAAEDLLSRLKERGITVFAGRASAARIVLLRTSAASASEILRRNHLEFTPAMKDEGYVLITKGSTTYDIAASSAGIYYGLQTIAQLITGRGASAVMQGATVRDWPALKYRGLSHDLARGPVSTLEFQKLIVRMLSEYKVNIYSPYFEVNFPYAGNPLPAPFGGTISLADAAALVAYARRFHVTVVPEQEAFGHLHHALLYEQYADLSESPLGSSFAPGVPGSADLVRQWFSQITTAFPSPFVHIGADEVNETGLGQSKQLVAQQGGEKVYIDFLTRLHDVLAPFHRRLLFWGDIAMKNPELVHLIPKDMIAVAWEYGPKPEGFEKWIKPFTDVGIETWVAPGINSWNRLYPDNSDTLLNIQEFVGDGQRFGATGELNTMWNDDNEGLFNNDWYGILFGAAAGWQASKSDIPTFQQSFGQVFHGDPTGKINQAQLEMTAAHLAFRGAGFHNGAMTELFWSDPWSEQGQISSAKILPHVHEIRMHAEHAITLIREAEAANPLRETDALDAMEFAARRIDFVAFKFQAAQQMVDAYNLALAQHNAKRQVGNPLFHIDYLYDDMVLQLGQFHDMFQAAWQKEDRPYTEHNVLLRYDRSMILWMNRSDLFRDAKLHFNETNVVPPAEEIGMPKATATH
jgi:hexosaminidase